MVTYFFTCPYYNFMFFSISITKNRNNIESFCSCHCLHKENGILKTSVIWKIKLSLFQKLPVIQKTVKTSIILIVTVVIPASHAKKLIRDSLIQNITFGIYLVERSAADIGFLFYRHTIECLQNIGGWIQVIAVHKGDILTPCNIHSCISCRASSCRLLLMNHRDPGIACGIFISYGAASIGRTVVYNEDLNIPQCLPQYIVKTFSEISPTVPHWYNHANRRNLHAIIPQQPSSPRQSGTKSG